MNTAVVDVPRLIRIATLLFAILAGALVYFAEEPRVEGAQLRLDADQADLRSDDVGVAMMPRLQSERTALARRYDTAYVRSPEAIFLRELASTVGRHGVDLMSTSVAPAQKALSANDSPHRELFTQTSMSLELRGTYPHLLATIRDLSLGSSIVSVDAPAFKRDGPDLIATVPVTIFEPGASAP